MSLVALANHLPVESSERAESFKKAREVFVDSGLTNLAEMVDSMG